MQFDLNRTLALIKGALFDQQATWAGYKAEEKSWLDTSGLLTLPLILGAALVTFILSFIFQKYYILGGPSIGSLFMSVIGGAVGVGLWSGVSWFFGKMFGGTDKFGRSFAAVSLGFVPGFIGSALGALPLLGWILSLAAGIFSLVCLYRLLPIFLDLPEENQVKHFVTTLLVSVVLYIVIALMLGLGAVGQSVSGIDVPDSNVARSSTGSTDSTDGSGPDFFGLGRDGKYVEAATSDRYDPPRDGRLSQGQVERTVEYLQKTQQVRKHYAENLEKMGERGEAGEEPSLGDIFKGIKNVAGVGTAEMQVVKSGGGNWAEHEWIKQALFEAQIHQDSNDAIAHNYKLYQKYETELENLL